MRVGRVQIGVIGAGACPPEIERIAEEVGREIARQGAVLLCGGLGGVMEAAARGAREAGGLTVGILPGPSAAEGNRFLDVRLATDMGHARNVILVRSSDAVIAVSGGYGTLSEIAIARKIGIPCVGIRTWDLDAGIVRIEEPAQAVRHAMGSIEGGGGG